MTAERRSFDRVADVYDTTRALPTDVAGAITAAIARVLREDTADACLLEVGIGTGRIAVPLAEAGVRVVGVDVAPRMLSRLRARRPDLAVAIADAHQLPFRPGSFAAALFVHVLHLMPDARAVLRAAATTVRTGGALLLGRTETSSPTRRAVATAMRGLTGELVGLSFPTRDWNVAATADFRAVAESLGAKLSSSVLATWEESTTARQVIEALAGRVYSSSWSIPDALMPELLRQVSPRIEQLFGGLDRVVSSPGRFTLDVARLS